MDEHEKRAAWRKIAAYLVLAAILSRSSFPVCSELQRQVVSVRVIGGPVTMLDLAVSDSSSLAQCPDGPIPDKPTVVDSLGAEIGELLVWVEGGRLSGLEFAWWSDEAPAGLPRIEDLRW